MSCERMQTRLLEFLDGRLKPNELPEVEKHLAACASCRLRVEEFRAVSGLLDELPMIEPSPAFDARVRARVAAEPPARHGFWAFLHFSPRIAFAASALLLAIVWFGYTRPVSAPPPSIDDAQMMQDLPVLEDHDVLTNFEPLKDLPAAAQADDDKDPQQM